MKQTDENAVIVLRRLREHFKDDAIGREVLSYTINRLKGLIENPTVEQKHGHWEWQKEDIYRCSECGEDIQVKEVMNIPQYKCCPMCMAIMSPDGLLATEISDVIEDMPTVERKSGNWIIKNTPPRGDGVFVCSECGSIDRDIGIPKFCRICGSKNSMKD